MSSGTPRVVVLGAGVAGLEAAFLLHRRLHGRVDLQLVSESDDFLFRPNLVYVALGADASASRIYLEGALWKDEITLKPGRVEGVDTDVGRVHVSRGRDLPYEHLVIATGAICRPQAIPGLQEHAVSIWDSAGMLALRECFEHVRGRAREGARQRVLFVVPRGNRCSLPLYEIALMLDTWLRRQSARDHVDIGFVTHEASVSRGVRPAHARDRRSRAGSRRDRARRAG